MLKLFEISTLEGRTLCMPDEPHDAIQVVCEW